MLPPPLTRVAPFVCIQSMKGLNRNVGAFLLPFVTGGGLPGVGIGVIWIPHYPAVAPTRVAACPVAPKKDSLLCKEVILCGCVQGTPYW